MKTKNVNTEGVQGTETVKGKPSKAYTVKQFTTAVIALAKTDLINQEEKDVLSDINRKVGFRYVGLDL